MQTLKILKVMVSCPADVSDEADAVESTITELNKSAGDVLGLRLDTFRWDRDATPGHGKDVQEVINVQIAEKFDILVAIFWTRIGTPTPRAQSGTVEEISAAIERIRNKPNSIHLLVYFKTERPDLYKLDPDQFAQVLAFRQTLGSMGVLFRDFSDVENLKSSLRVNLIQAAKALVEIPDAVPESIRDATHSPSTGAAELLQDEDELGLLDYLDIHESKLEIATARMIDVTSVLDNLRHSTERRTRETNELRESGKLTRSELRRLLKRGADDWDLTAGKVEVLSDEFQTASAEAFKALSRAIPYMSFGTEDAKKQRLDLAEKIETTAETFRSVSRSNADFRAIISGFPRLTGEHNRAKKVLLSVLEKAAGQYDGVADLATDIAVALRKI